MAVSVLTVLAGAAGLSASSTVGWICIGIDTTTVTFNLIPTALACAIEALTVGGAAFIAFVTVSICELKIDAYVTTSGETAGTVQVTSSVVTYLATRACVHAASTMIGVIGGIDAFLIAFFEAI